jgi:hypothetical protein
MRRAVVAMVLALLCVSSVGCKKGSGSSEDAGVDANVPDGGMGGAGGIGGAAGIGGTGGAAGIGGTGGSACEGKICDDKCVDVNTDDEHCGACGQPCQGATTCIGGLCVG